MIGTGKMYVLVNKDLGMSPGKVAAQVAHVVSRLDQDPPKIVIVLEGTTEQLRNLREYLEGMHLPNTSYIDEGVNEVPPMSLTAVAFSGVVEEFTPDFIAGFELYQYKDKELEHAAEQLGRAARCLSGRYYNIPHKIRSKYDYSCDTC